MRGTTLVAAADPDAGARARAGRLVRGPVLERAEDLLARDDVDALVICAPTHRHAELAVAAAEAGKHFYLEKPIATTAEDARRVVDGAARAGIVATMGFHRRLHPVCEQVRALVAAGRIGPVHAVQTAFCEPLPAGTMGAWRRRRATGGGVLLDLASHHIDLVRWLLDDEVEAVEARVTSDESEQDGARLDLTMRRGTVVQSVFSFRAGLADWLELIGEGGTLRVDRHRRGPAVRVARRFGYGMRTAWAMPSAGTLASSVARLVRPSSDPSYRRSLVAFLDAVRGDAMRGATLADGVRSLDVVLAAEESARRGGPVCASS